MNTLLGALMFGLVLIAFGVAGEADYHEAQRLEREYCAMVAQGAWPDYERKFDKVCKEGKLK
jgi:hypothetical protein